MNYTNLCGWILSLMLVVPFVSICGVRLTGLLALSTLTLTLGCLGWRARK